MKLRMTMVKLRMTIVAFVFVTLSLSKGALALTPSVASVDANARASGSERAVAVDVGKRIFTTTWPVQVLQVVASGVAGHVIIGMRLSGVKFHAPTGRPQFDREVLALVQTAFAADPQIEEVDLWATVPLDVRKGLDVSGDLAQPAWRTVFSISARRSESSAGLEHRLSAGTGVFLDPEWATTAFTKK